MTSRRRATRFTSVIIGTSMLLTACGGNDSAEVPQAATEKPAGDVEIVTVTQYNDGTVLGPDDEAYPSDTSLPLGAISLVEDRGRVEEL